MSHPSLVFVRSPRPVLLPFVPSDTCETHDIGMIHGKHYMRKSKPRAQRELYVNKMSYHPCLITSCNGELLIKDDDRYVYIPFFEDIRGDVDAQIDNISGQQLIDMFSVVNHVHDNEFIHSDIKPANIIILANGKIKLIDFEGCQPCSGLIRSVVTQTLDYTAPEINKGVPFDGFKTDVFALGVVLYNCIAKTDIELDKFHENCDEKLATFKEEYSNDDQRNGCPSKSIDDLWNLVKMMTKPDPVDRCTMAKASKELNEIVYYYRLESVII